MTKTFTTVASLRTAQSAGDNAIEPNCGRIFCLKF